MSEEKGEEDADRTAPNGQRPMPHETETAVLKPSPSDGGEFHHPANIEALGKLSENWISIDWLISGRCVPYNSKMPPKELIDLVFIIHMKDIFRTILSDASLLTENEKLGLLSYCMSNNYLGIGDVVHGLIESGLGEPKAILAEISSGDIDYMLDNVPRNEKELWNALRKVKEAVRRSLEIPPYPKEDEVGE